MVGRKNLFLRQADAITAYLNTEMPDEVYIKLPSICGDDADMVRHILRALYGHPKAGQLWNVDFVQFMVSEGLVQCPRDKCLFIHPILFLLVLYEDDLLGACKSKSYINKFWRKLSARLKISGIWATLIFCWGLQ